MILFILWLHIEWVILDEIITEDGQQQLTCMGDTATRLESDLDRDLDSCRSNTLRGMDLILPRVQALSS